MWNEMIQQLQNNTLQRRRKNKNYYYTGNGKDIRDTTATSTTTNVKDTKQSNDSDGKDGKDKKETKDFKEDKKALSSTATAKVIPLTSPSLWKPRYPIQTLHTTSESFTDSLQKHKNTVEFQLSLLKSDRKTARYYMNSEMDNSVCWINGKQNPVRLWAEMKDCKNDHNGELLHLYQALLRTGAQKWVNMMDSVDGKRPIDVACVIQFQILCFQSPDIFVDVNPTALHSPLYHALDTFNLSQKHICDLIKKMDRTQLDWEHPDHQHKTALYLLCVDYQVQHLGYPDKMHWEEQRRYLIYFMLSFVPDVNPFHVCLKGNILNDVTEVGCFLNVGKMAWNQYRDGHLPNQISSVLFNVPQELIEMIVDYVMYY
jgi:hypothetical protein